jgi:transposase
MAMGRQGPRQAELLLGWDDLPRSPGQVFWDRMGELLKDAGFAAFVETQGQPFYAPVMGARPLPPGRDVRMHLIGYFEGSSSVRGIEWRCADSLSLRAFVGPGATGRVPDHAWLSRTRARLPLEVQGGGLRLGAGASGRARPDQGQADRHRCLDPGGECGDAPKAPPRGAVLRMWPAARRRRELPPDAQAGWPRRAGVATPTAADLKQMDRKRRGKRTSNEEWESAPDPDAKITRLKDGRTRLA